MDERKLWGPSEKALDRRIELFGSDEDNYRAYRQRTKRRAAALKQATGEEGFGCDGLDREGRSFLVGGRAFYDAYNETWSMTVPGRTPDSEPLRLRGRGLASLMRTLG